MFVINRAGVTSLAPMLLAALVVHTWSAAAAAGATGATGATTTSLITGTGLLAYSAAVLGQNILRGGACLSPSLPPLPSITSLLFPSPSLSLPLPLPPFLVPSPPSSPALPLEEGPLKCS